MLESIEGENRFRMDTDNIPEGVDPELAHVRNNLIEKWRQGVASSVATHTALMRLYWENQNRTSSENSIFLMSSFYQFPVEAGIPEEDSQKIYEEVFSSIKEE